MPFSCSKDKKTRGPCYFNWWPGINAIESFLLYATEADPSSYSLVKDFGSNTDL